MSLPPVVMAVIISHCPVYRVCPAATHCQDSCMIAQTDRRRLVPGFARSPGSPCWRSCRWCSTTPVAGPGIRATRTSQVPGAPPLAPAIIGVVLGPMAEQQLRRALAIGEGSPPVLVTRPVSLALRPPVRRHRQRRFLRVVQHHRGSATYAVRVSRAASLPVDDERNGGCRSLVRGRRSPPGATTSCCRMIDRMGAIPVWKSCSGSRTLATPPTEAIGTGIKLSSGAI
jgi:hypothetical protein